MSLKKINNYSQDVPWGVGTARPEQCNAFSLELVIYKKLMLLSHALSLEVITEKKRFTFFVAKIKDYKIK